MHSEEYLSALGGYSVAVVGRRHISVPHNRKAATMCDLVVMRGHVGLYLCC